MIPVTAYSSYGIEQYVLNVLDCRFGNEEAKRTALTLDLIRLIVNDFVCI